jgi:hypothetical protein
MKRLSWLLAGLIVLALGWVALTMLEGRLYPPTPNISQREMLIPIDEGETHLPVQRVPPGDDPGPSPASPSEPANPQNEAKVAELLQKLQEPNRPDRPATLKALAALGPKARSAVPRLVEMLKDSREETQLEIAQTLLLMNQKAELASETLFQGLKSKDPDIRASATNRLAQLTYPPYVKESGEGTGEPSRVCRTWLGKRALLALEPLREDPEEKVRLAAKEAIGRIKLLQNILLAGQ